MKLSFQMKKIKHFDFFMAAQIALILFTCLVNLGQSQLNLPQHDYDYYDHTRVNFHTHHHHHPSPNNFHSLPVNPYRHHHHHNPNTHSLPVNPYRHHRRPISKRHSWISGTFYNEVDFKGLPMSYYFAGTSCVNFPRYQRMHSLKPYGCIMLFKHQNCQGPVSMVFENMPNLHVIGMSDGIASIKNCMTDYNEPNNYHYRHPPPHSHGPLKFPPYKK